MGLYPPPNRIFHRHHKCLLKHRFSLDVHVTLAFWFSWSWLVNIPACLVSIHQYLSRCISFIQPLILQRMLILYRRGVPSLTLTGVLLALRRSYWILPRTTVLCFSLPILLAAPTPGQQISAHVPHSSWHPSLIRVQTIPGAQCHSPSLRTSGSPTLSHI
uniref:Uncharacterized protein n=1 Tax=Pipistrellus kuhlii TaxID=59472 RepID=A0A7J7TK82_PIPKU|nr:hypothetical protein mPipKuh1_009360 [Pipistrellus kuhlii]